MIGKQLEKTQILKTLSSISFQKPRHGSTFFPLHFLPRSPSPKKHDVLYGRQALLGNHFLPLKPLLPKTWSLALAWWIGIWVGSTDWDYSGYLKLMATCSYPCTLQVPCYHSNLLAGNISHSHQRPPRTPLQESILSYEHSGSTQGRC